VAFPLISVVYVYALFVLAVLSLAAFYVVERKAEQPMMDFGLFREKLFTYACAANAINGLARGAVLFVLIFFLQGPYGLDPLWAGIMMAPFGLLSCSWTCLRPPLRQIWLPGPGHCRAAHLRHRASGLATVVSSTPYWLLAIYQALMGGGSGLFASPNTNAVMSSVVPQKKRHCRRGQLYAHEHRADAQHRIVFPLVLSRIPEDVMFHVFLFGGGMSGAPLAASSPACTRRSWPASQLHWLRRSSLLCAST